MSDRAPVTDWERDFDHVDPVWTTDPYPIWEDLRRTCPVAHTDRYGGAWLPTRHDDIAAIAYDTDHFTSQDVIVSEARPEVDAPMGPAPPITSDPPFHAFARRLLLPAFSPKAVSAWEPATRDVCRRLVDELARRDTIDAAVDYAQHVPVGVIAAMLGLPDDDADVFRHFIHEAIEDIGAPADAVPYEDSFDGYLDAAIEDHRRHPRDDLIGYLLTLGIDGEPLAHEHIRGTIALLLIAGIDTTWSAIGASLWHLAQHPAHRARLAADPGLVPTAVEELLRAYAPVTMARLVRHDVDFRGNRMQAGEWVLLPFPAANRDPDWFEDPDTVVLDRAVNRHSAFGLGIHRCIGSNLARMEMRVALEEWMARIPEFELVDPLEVRWSSGQVRGPRSVPVRIVDTRAA